MKIRKRTMLIVPAAAALMLGAGVGPASAASNNARPDCVAGTATFFNQYVGHGLGGRIIADEAPPSYASYCHY